VELGNELTGTPCNRNFKALESGSAGTDTALAELKAKMGLPAPRPKAPCPPSSQDESKIPSVLTRSRNKVRRGSRDWLLAGTRPTD